MRIATRRLFAATCLAFVVAAGCGEWTPPAGPSGWGATIAGTVNGRNALALSSPMAMGLAPGAASSGLTVTVVGTDLTVNVDVSGRFQITGVPPGDVQLSFSDGSVSATISLEDVGNQQLVEIQVNLNGGSAVVVSDVRSDGKVSLCHSTGNGSYHMINVSVNAEPAHRAHGDGEVGDEVPADPTKVFDSSCRPVTLGVDIEKSTNGEDADQAPGPRVPVGSPITWQYVVTNTGETELTNVLVTDSDPAVVVNCNGQTTLAAGQFMTCTATGIAQAGQYSNVGTASATSAAGAVDDTDASHYFGETEDRDDDGPKVALCHRTGNGSYHLINVSKSAEPAHRAHGDGQIGEAVPGDPGKVFGPGCTVS